VYLLESSCCWHSSSHTILAGNLKERDYLGHHSRDSRIVLKLIVYKQSVMMWNLVKLTITALSPANANLFARKTTDFFCANTIYNTGHKWKTTDKWSPRFQVSVTSLLAKDCYTPFRVHLSTPSTILKCYVFLSSLLNHVILSRSWVKYVVPTGVVRWRHCAYSSR
jgi:hypothetical protein